MTPTTAEHDTTYATIAYVALALKGEGELRKAESQRVNDLLAGQMHHFESLVAGVKDTVRAEVSRIDALFSTGQRDIIAGQVRTEATATNLALGVKELSTTMAQGVEDTRAANQASVDRNNEAVDARLKPLEAAMNTGSGRSTVTDKLLFAVLGVVFTILGGIIGRLVMGT